MVNARETWLLAFLLTGLGACSKETPAPVLTRPVAGQLVDVALQDLVASSLLDAEANPNDAAKRATLGLVYEANQVWSLAATCFENAAALDPSRPEYPTHAATCMLRCGRSSEAEELIRETSERFPEFAPGRFRRGTALLDSGDAAGALAEFGACEKLVDWFAEIHVVMAEALIALDRNEEALTRIERQLATAPASRRAHFVRGLALQGLGRTEEAERSLAYGQGAERRFLPDQLDDRLRDYIVETRILLVAAEDLRSKGFEPQAIQMLERASQRKPNDAVLLNTLAVFARRTGNPERASRLLEKATALAPDTIEFWINWSLANADLDRKEEALEAATRAVDLDRTNARAQLVLGRSLSALERFPEALTALEESNRLESETDLTHLSLAEAHLGLGQFADAEPLLRSLVERLPDKYWPRHHLCATQLRLGRSDLARKNLQALRERYPRDARLAELNELFR